MKTLLIQLIVLLIALVGWVVYSRIDSIEDSLQAAKQQVGESLPASLSDVLPQTASGQDGDQTRNTGQQNQAGNTQTVYKWQDADGSWHFGDKPPANIKAVESRQYTIQPSRPDPPPGEAAGPATNTHATNSSRPPPRQRSSNNTDGSQPGLDSALPTPGNISRILQQAQQAADAMNQHNQNIDSIINGGSPGGSSAEGTAPVNRNSGNPYRVYNGR